MPRMPEPGKATFIAKPIRSSNVMKPECTSPPGMVCERCGADMFRMHAVWRCPRCRFKTDCCGW
jgi:hypothetical protein